MKYITAMMQSSRKKDEDRNIENTFQLDGWPYIGWPRVKKYRVIHDPNRSAHQLRLQAFYQKNWVEVKTYDNGYDDYGKLHEGRWVELSSQCAWTKEGLERVAQEALGKKFHSSVVSEIA